jgi:hypothetical protein
MGATRRLFLYLKNTPTLLRREFLLVILISKIRRLLKKGKNLMKTMKTLLLTLLLCASINKAGLLVPQVELAPQVAIIPPIPEAMLAIAQNMCTPINHTGMTDAVIEFAWEASHQNDQVHTFMELLHQDLLYFPEYAETQNDVVGEVVPTGNVNDDVDHL